MKKLVGLCLLVLVVSIVAGCSSSNKVNSTVSKEKEQVSTIIDASQFSRISESEIEKILGDPESVEDWEFNGYEATKLTYNKGNYEFLIIEDSVVRFTYMGSGKFKNENDLFEMFGIKPRDGNTKVVDTGSVLSYHSVADNVGEFYVLRDANDKSVIDVVRITYNLNYFE